MPVIKMTQKIIDKLPFEQSGQKLYWDEQLPGFGIRVGKKTKAYMVQKDINGRSKQVPIGRDYTYPFNLAREEAKEFLLKMARGVDPTKEKKEKRNRGKTLNDHFHAYIENAKHRKLSNNTMSFYTYLMDRFFSDWGTKSLAEIDKGMVEKKYKEGKKIGDYAVDGAFKLLSAIYVSAQAEDENIKNPVLVLKQKKLRLKRERRKSYIREDQLAAWYSAVQNLQNKCIRDALIVLLFTGMRKNEVFEMRWENVDLNRRTLLIPKTKNGESLTLPLSNFLFELFSRRSDDAGSSPWIFPSDGKKGHLVDVRKALLQVQGKTGIKNTVHDLRRTFATIAEGLGISTHTLKELLNHKTDNDVTSGYIVRGVERLREPVQKIADKMLGLMREI